MSILLAQHNVPLAFADHLSPLVRDIFDDEVAKKYSCTKTKTTCILNGAVAPEFASELVSYMQSALFTLSVDGSNDTGLEKMNPLTVRIFDINRGKVDTQFFDMCTTAGLQAATADAIFGKMNEALLTRSIFWNNCVGVGVDNTSVNIGCHNSIMTQVHEVNPSVYFMGRPCHIAHNTVSHAADALSKATRFDVEELVVDIFYWFDKSSKRKDNIHDYCCFCNVEYKQVLKHVSIRWLSLERAVERILKVYNVLKSYFLSESQARFKRLHSIFSNPLSEVYLLFYQSILPVFSKFNLFLQREDPCIHLVYDHCQSLLRKLLNKFMEVSALRDQNACDVDHLNNQLSDETIFVGFITRQKMRKLENEGDISQAAKKFIQGVRSFYEAAVQYVTDKFLLHDDDLLHARVANFLTRSTSSFPDVEFFLWRSIALY